MEKQVATYTIPEEVRKALHRDFFNVKLKTVENATEIFNIIADDSLLDNYKIHVFIDEDCDIILEFYIDEPNCKVWLHFTDVRSDCFWGISSSRERGDITATGSLLSIGHTKALLQSVFKFQKAMCALTPIKTFPKFTKKFLDTVKKNSEEVDGWPEEKTINYRKTDD